LISLFGTRAQTPDSPDAKSRAPGRCPAYGPYSIPQNPEMGNGATVGNIAKLSSLWLTPLQPWGRGFLVGHGGGGGGLGASAVVEGSKNRRSCNHRRALILMERGVRLDEGRSRGTWYRLTPTRNCENEGPKQRKPQGVSFGSREGLVHVRPVKAECGRLMT